MPAEMKARRRVGFLLNRFGPETEGSVPSWCHWLSGDPIGGHCNNCTGEKDRESTTEPGRLKGLLMLFSPF